MTNKQQQKKQNNRRPQGQQQQNRRACPPGRRRGPRKPKAPQVAVPAAAATMVAGGGAYSLKSIRRGAGRAWNSDVGKGIRAVVARGFPLLSGMGDYELTQNSLGGKDKMASTVPLMHSGSEGVINIKHHEYIGDLLSSSSPFKMGTYTLNPGNATTFPWLSNIASAFTQYRWRGLAFYFKTLSGNNMSHMNQGFVVGGVEYNPYMMLPSTKQQVEQLTMAASGLPGQDLIIPVECDPHQNPVGEFFVRSSTGTPPTLVGAIGGNMPVTMYEVGQLIIASGGCPDDSVVMGELWVTYDVDLLKPVTDQLAFQAPTAHYSYIGTAGFGPTNAAPLGLLTQKFDNIGLNIGSSGGFGTISFPANTTGAYKIDVTWRGASTVVTNIVPSVNGGFVFVKIFNGDSASVEVTPPGGSTTTTQSCSTVVYAGPTNALTQSVVLGVTTLPTGILSCDLTVTMLNYYDAISAAA